jgi:hypothetical protein
MEVTRFQKREGVETSFSEVQSQVAEWADMIVSSGSIRSMMLLPLA